MPPDTVVPYKYPRSRSNMGSGRLLSIDRAASMICSFVIVFGIIRFPLPRLAIFRSLIIRVRCKVSGLLTRISRSARPLSLPLTPFAPLASARAA